MKVQVIREIEIGDNLPEEVKHEVNRVSHLNMSEEWLTKYVDACLTLYREGMIEYRRNDLFKIAAQWLDSGREKEGHDLRWAASNLWWAIDREGLIAGLQYVAEDWRKRGNKKEAKLVAWLTENIPWGKLKIVTDADLVNLASKLEASGKPEEARALLRGTCCSIDRMAGNIVDYTVNFPYPKDPIVVATLNQPWRRIDSMIENPSVLAVMLLEGKH